MRLKLGFIIGIIVAFTFGSCLGVRAQNLLPNSDFEEVGAQAGSGTWFIEYWQASSKLGFTDLTAHHGKYAAFIQSNRENDARLIQKVAVEPNTVYRFSGWVATENVPENKFGANLCVMGGYFHSAAIKGTRQWQPVELFFRTQNTQREVTLGVRLGFYGNTDRGLAYFDELKLEKVPEQQYPCETLDDNSVKYAPNLSQQPALGKVDAKMTVAQRAIQFLRGLFGYPTATVAFYLLLAAALLFRTDRWKFKGFGLEEPSLFQARLPWFFGLTALVAFLVRIPLLPAAPFASDMACFHGWGMRIADTGPGAFYQPGYFCDYPPFALYILWVVGALAKVLHLTGNYEAFTFLIKLPGFFCDLGTAWLIILFLRPQNPLLGWGLAAGYLFMPGVIINSAFWGQVDTYYVFLVLAAFYALAVKQEPEAAAGLAMASLLTKTQTIAFLPLLFIYLFLNFPWKRVLLTVGAALGTFVVIVFPFNVLQRLGWFVEFYSKQAANYPYAAVNAANFLTLLKGNFVSDAMQILPGISYKTLGSVLFVICVIWSGYYYWRKKNREGLIAAALFVAFGFFMFFPRMHERYLFPAMALFVLAGGLYRDKKLLGLGGVVSIAYLLNSYVVLLNIQSLMDGSTLNRWLIILAIVNTVAFGLTWLVLQVDLLKVEGKGKRLMGGFTKKKLEIRSE